MKKLWRVVFVTLLFLVVLSLLTAEKVAYVWILRAIGAPDVPIPVGYAALTLLLVSPYLLAFLQGVWNVSFLTRCPDTRLPPVHNVLLGMLCSILEGACVMWFTTMAASVLPVFVVLPAVSSVLAFSTVSPVLSSPQGSEEPDKLDDFTKAPAESRCSCVRQYMAMVAVLGPPVAAFVLYLSGVLPWLQCVVFAVTLLLLSVIWSPGIQFRTASVNGEVSLNCRRLSVLYLFLKLASVCFFISVDVVVYGAEDQTAGEIGRDFFRHFMDMKKKALLVPILLSISAGIFSHGFAYLSVAFCQPVFGLLVPSVLSTVVSIVLCVGYFGPYVYHVQELTHFGDIIPLGLVACILASTWAMAYVLRTFDAIRKPCFLFMPYEDLLIEYGWCSAFSDQRRLLSFCADGATREGVLQQPVRAKKSRVYVCTTMYREADYEMERLLLSLQRLSIGECLQNVYMEAHIFMDNGINGERLGDFAEQLVGLLVSRLGMNPEEARCLVTPYGMQLTCFLPGGMPLFVHLKDPVKVKPKKRWSQCMYINYIMKFRKVMWDQDEDNYGRLQNCGDSKIYFINDKSSNKNMPEFTPNAGAPSSSSRKIRSVGYPTFSEFTQGFENNLDVHDPGFASVDLSPTPSSSRSFQCSDEFARETVDPKASLCNLMDENGSYGAGVDNPAMTREDSSPYDIVEIKPRDGAEIKTIPRNNTSFEFKFDPEVEIDDEHTYILATDADMDFEPDAVAELLRLCNNDRRLGAACGRTHPIGKRCSSIVWHQIFEYAKDFWMIKSAQNVIGSVMCCPGCFSLYRAAAIHQVMDKYATPTRTPFTVYVKDTGEDRWMATLMMINGWRLRYSAFADNTTYCPDSFQEFFKQRRRWILSDIANLILVVQNMPRLLRNNECFSFAYVVYLFNMFMNNVITPGTAIVMITAGMELVFDVPYIYTTPPLAVVVYIYAFMCTRTSTHVQGMVTSVLTVILGSIFVSVAIWGSYKIVDGMVSELNTGRFHFQQHYIILMLTVSLLYAAITHPRECHQITYGLAYLFIFPAMHLLLPIYSIANIIDQSWGTRDSQEAKIPRLKCLPNIKKMMKMRKKSKSRLNAIEDTTLNIQEMVTAMTRPMVEGSAQEQEENAFWESLRDRLLGNDINKGLERAELADRLEKLRNRSLLGVMAINAVWLAMLSYFYVGIDSPLSRLNLYGVISGALYGFTLLIQVIGMTICRANYILRRMAVYLYGDRHPVWVCPKPKRP